MADPTPPRDGLGPLIDRMAAMESRLRELEKPTATQYANAVGNLVEFGEIGQSQMAFTVPTDWATVTEGTIAVPDGYTRAAFLGIVSIGAWNGSATGDYLYVRCLLDGTPGASLPVYAGPSAYGTVAASAIRTIEDLTPGESINIACQARAASGWGSAASNIANIDVIALFRK